MSDLAEQKNETPDEQELSGEIVRDSKGRFIKGYSGNPAGNTKNRGIEQLVQAIKKVEEKHGIDYFEEIVERSRTDSVLTAALLRKLVPDRKAIEAEIKQENEQVVPVSFNPSAVLPMLSALINRNWYYTQRPLLRIPDPGTHFRQVSW